ncbi:unnamed protein product [Prunus armeniaca]
MDNLEVKPMTTESSVEVKEGLKLFKASLESNTALTNVFLGKKQHKLFNFGPLATLSFWGFILYSRAAICLKYIVFKLEYPRGYTGFIDHCNSLIDELVDNGIIPYVTLLHFDLPQGLENKYLGPLNRSFVDDFKAYTEICLRTFGDRVKNWITINEQLNIAKFGYEFGIAAPGRCSISAGLLCIALAIQPLNLTL